MKTVLLAAAVVAVLTSGCENYGTMPAASYPAIRAFPRSYGANDVSELSQRVQELEERRGFGQRSLSFFSLGVINAYDHRVTVSRC